MVGWPPAPGASSGGGGGGGEDEDMPPQNVFSALLGGPNQEAEIVRAFWVVPPSDAANLSITCAAFALRGNGTATPDPTLVLYAVAEATAVVLHDPIPVGAEELDGGAVFEAAVAEVVALRTGEAEIPNPAVGEPWILIASGRFGPPDGKAPPVSLTGHAVTVTISDA